MPAALRSPAGVCGPECAHKALGFGAHTYSRTDFRCDAAGEPMYLEVNARPGLTVTSLLPLAASGAGWTYADLAERIVSLATL
ncbi:hypothetical protein [Streptomyces sp. NRRL S-31]|uniref:hypothetical protein n=1 Tax=Streptomyces sp. NRRL S-31 TaxID=1463898 RepID=UPI0020A62D21|nr:hypothetical protein [Streptomyces sp. NRRL S-31]